MDKDKTWKITFGRTDVEGTGRDSNFSKILLAISIIGVSLVVITSFLGLSYEVTTHPIAKAFFITFAAAMAIWSIYLLSKKRIDIVLIAGVVIGILSIFV